MGRVSAVKEDFENSQWDERSVLTIGRIVNNEPPVSIGMPTYNRAAGLRHAIVSALAPGLPAHRVNHFRQCLDG